MKSLSKYLLESIAPIFEMVEDKDSLIKQLSSNVDLGEDNPDDMDTAKPDKKVV